MFNCSEYNRASEAAKMIAESDGDRLVLEVAANYLARTPSRVPPEAETITNALDAAEALCVALVDRRYAAARREAGLGPVEVINDGDNDGM